jgi:hypothetical protein
MARLTWSAVGERFYEAGVDRGVLYVDDVGYSWSGLVSVDEGPTGGDARPYYLDGVKYLNLSNREEFQATLNALFSPPEFDACDGVGTVRPGLYAGQQRRKSFGLCYRTGIGNDINGIVHGYKIHLIYNALAAPSNRQRSTLGDSPQPTMLSWRITTKPVPVPDMMRSSHLTIDTREAPTYVVALLEDILYGNDLNAPRLPDPDEIAALFDDDTPFTVTDLGTGELFEIEGSDLAVQELAVGRYQINEDGVVALDSDRAQISS